MKKILKRKLKNARGASIIIAMVFMLICVFVGGSVLTAATMNAYRIEHYSDQQAFLNQRSAATLVADGLRPSGREPMTLTVYDSLVTTQNVRVAGDGTLIPDSLKTSKHVVRFTTSENDLSTFQRTLCEAAVKNYIAQSGLDPTSVQIQLENFNFGGNPVKYENFWLTEPKGVFQVSGSYTNNEDHSIIDLDSFSAEFKCSSAYDYTVTFGEDVQMEVSMRASVPGVRQLPTIKQIAPRDPVHPDPALGVESTSTTRITTIIWRNPRILKGKS